LVRNEDGDLLPFPARELDTYRNHYASIQNRAPPPARAQEHGHVLFAGFNPAPNTYADTVDQAGGFDFPARLFQENCLFELRDNRLPTCVPARNTHCLIVNQQKWCCLCVPLFHKVQMSVRLCVNLFIFCRDSMQQDSDTKTLSPRAQ
jgi:hypothetical protein